MPTIAPSYLYTFFALVTVASILISSFAAYATKLRNIPETKQLENILNYVAAFGWELSTLTTSTNTTSSTTLNLPSTIGDKNYWIRFHNGIARTWVEGSLGSIHEGIPASLVYLPKHIYAHGNFSSYNGRALLECNWNGSTIILHLTSWREIF